MPRITSADAVWASLRCRAHTPREHITLTMPVSSSRLRNVTPCAVAGRCRWVTAPATSTRVPSGTDSRRLAGTHAHLVERLPQELDGMAVRRHAGGPDVGGGQLEFGHAGQRRDVRRGPDAGQPVGTLRGRRARRPQRLPPVDPEAPERARGGQRLGLRHRQLHPARQIHQRGERAVGLSVVDDPLGQLVTDVPDRAETSRTSRPRSPASRAPGWRSRPDRAPRPRADGRRRPATAASRSPSAGPAAAPRRTPRGGAA